MITRKTPRSVPDRAHYKTISLTGIGDTVWRLPSPGYALMLIRLINNDSLVEKSIAVQAGDLEAASEMRDKMVDLYSIQGAVIGFCWFNQEHDLETPRGRLPTADALLEYGGAVYEELYEAEWKPSQIMEAWGCLLPLMIDTLVDTEKGNDHANFTPAPPGPPDS